MNNRKVTSGRWAAGFLTFSAMWIFFAMPQAMNADEPLPGGHFTFTGVKARPIDRINVGGKISDRESENLTHWIRFDIHPTYVVAKGSESKAFKILNPTVGSKSRLTLDKPIKFKGTDVPAGTNLLQYKKFDGSLFNVSMPNLFPLAIHSVRITKDFELPADAYTVKFEWKTEKGETFSDTVKVHIDVDLSAR